MRHRWGPLTPEAEQAFTLGLDEAARQCVVCGLIRRSSEGQPLYQVVRRGKLRRLLAHDDKGGLFQRLPACRPERKVYESGHVLREFPPPTP